MVDPDGDEPMFGDRGHVFAGDGQGIEKDSLGV
jgi:hypothetical protein